MHYIGDPESQVPEWNYQELPDNCAVAAQTSIINQFIPDHHLSVQDADYLAYANGWYHPGNGTAQEDMGKMFELFDIPYHRVDNGSVDQLVSELQAGHRVMVSVNSDELWSSGPMAEFWHWFTKELGLDNATFSPANHAVDVIGVNCSDPSHPMVVLNDSGNPNGAGIEYPLDKFVDSWENSNFHYVATDIAPPQTSAPSLDLGDLLGIGAVGIGTAFGLDVATAMDAGALVSDLCHNVNWDEVLRAI